MGVTNVTVIKQYVKKDFYENAENAAAIGGVQGGVSGGSGDLGDYYSKDQINTLLEGKSSIVGTPVDNQLAIWTGATGIEGDSNLTWDGSDLNILGNVNMGDVTSDISVVIRNNTDSISSRLLYVAQNPDTEASENTTWIRGETSEASLLLGNFGTGLALNVTIGDVSVTDSLYSSDFVSGFQGTKWQINSDGDGEFEDLLVRGGLSVYELIINQLRYQDGGLIIGAGGGKISSINSATVGSEQVYMEDPEGNGIVPFTVGAIILMQDFDLNRTTLIKKIVRQVSAVQGDGRIDLTTTTGWLTSADTGIFADSDVLVSIGHVSDTDLDSTIYMSAVDSGNPFLRMMDGVNSYAKWSLSDKSAMKLQLGNLAALAEYDIIPASPGYGLYCNNVYLTGKIVASSGAIGGWIIDADSIQDAAGLVGMSSDVSSVDDVRFWAGHTTPSSAPFYVTEAGILQATSGTIGGWTLATDAFYTGTKDETGFTTDGITLSDDGTIHSPAFYTETGGNENFLYVDVLAVLGNAALGENVTWWGMNSEVTSTVFTAELSPQTKNVLVWTGGSQTLTLSTSTINKTGSVFWILNKGGGTVTVNTATGTNTVADDRFRGFMFYSAAWHCHT